MIKIEHTETTGWEAALRGMRNPMNSWNKADSVFLDGSAPDIGFNDIGLALNLAAAGPTHAKYRRMIVVYCDITAPLYWWKQMDTYKVGTVANSCSTMHKIMARPFELDDFSYDGLRAEDFAFLKATIIPILNDLVDEYREEKDRAAWSAVIKFLPECYNQKRTLMLNYEVLAGIYATRRNHKLDEWHDFCRWIETLPSSELITGGAK